MIRMMVLNCYYTAEESIGKTVVFVNGTAKDRIVKTKKK